MERSGVDESDRAKSSLELKKKMIDAAYRLERGNYYIDEKGNVWMPVKHWNDQHE